MRDTTDHICAWLHFYTAKANTCIQILDSVRQATNSAVISWNYYTVSFQLWLLWVSGLRSRKENNCKYFSRVFNWIQAREYRISDMCVCLFFVRCHSYFEQIACSHVCVCARSAQSIEISRETLYWNYIQQVSQLVDRPLIFVDSAMRRRSVTTAPIIMKLFQQNILASANQCTVATTSPVDNGH